MSYPNRLQLTVHTQPHWDGPDGPIPMEHFVVGRTFIVDCTDERNGSYTTPMIHKGNAVPHYFGIEFILEHCNIEKV